MDSDRENRIVSVFRTLSGHQVEAMNWYAFGSGAGPPPKAPLCRMLVFLGLLDTYKTEEIDDGLLLERRFYRMPAPILALWRRFSRRQLPLEASRLSLTDRQSGPSGNSSHRRL